MSEFVFVEDRLYLEESKNSSSPKVKNSNWVQYFDDESQSYYYYNLITGESSWEVPIELEIQPLYDYFHHELDEFGQEKNQYSDMSESDTENQQSNIVKSEKTESRERLDMEIHRKSETTYVGGQNQNYLELARTYKLQRPYMDPKSQPTCVLCHSEEATEVFFPCQHRCVCVTCRMSENICEFSQMKEGKFKKKNSQFNLGSNDEDSIVEIYQNADCFCNCPLCGEIIKKIFPFVDGREEDRYREWCYEIPPRLPPLFLKRFQDSENMIKRIYDIDIGKNEKLSQGKKDIGRKLSSSSIKDSEQASLLKNQVRTQKEENDEDDDEDERLTQQAICSSVGCVLS